ncbi:MAG TPA: superoxide dismutase family protein [Longimicrobiaceae bacterium]|nr:superoxide dismutase family protein [Longimicrobiaceae bacterium]
MRISQWVTGGAMVALAGCATMQGGGMTMRSTLRNAQGQEVGMLTLSPSGAGTHVMLRVHGMAPGTHGAHIHNTGRCDAPAFTSAGPHLNTTNRMHGTQNPQGPHRGDMPNLVVAADGTGTLNLDLATPWGDIFDGDGSAIVVHANADDYMTDPSGNSGARVACGTIGVRDM